MADIEHSGRQHALLSPSCSSRWLSCPPSIRLCEDIEQKPSKYAEEGTQAHEMCEYKLRSYLGEEVENPSEKLSYYCRQMEECSEEYLNYIIEKKSELQSPAVIVEQKVIYEKYVPFGSGLADCIILGNDELVVIDFKYGEGVPVSAKENTQLMLYALGAVIEFDYIYSIHNVTVCVFQPRLHNVSEWSIPKGELLQWAEDYVKPRAELAYKGEGDLCAGDWCRWCGVKSACRARADKNLELAKYKFRNPTRLEDYEIADILSRTADFKKWINDVEEYALSQALKGNTIKGYKVVEGISRRKIVDPQKVEETLLDKGLKDIYTEPKLLGITDLEKYVGAKQLKELCGEYIVKPQGSPTLVPVSDKRQEMVLRISGATSAKEVFADDIL